MRKTTFALRYVLTSIIALIALGLFLNTSLAELDRDSKDAKQKAPDEAKGTLGGDGSVSPEKSLEEKGKENLNKIIELMKKSQSNLSNKKTGKETQSIQKDVTKKIDELIEEILKASQQGQGGSGQQQQNQNKKQQGKDQKQGKQQQKNQNQEQMKPDSQKKKGEKEGQKKKESGKEKKGPTRHDQVSDGKNPKGKPRNLTDIFGTNKQWGILPRRLRDEAHQTQDRQFPAEYRDLISKYYERLANLYSDRKIK